MHLISSFVDNYLTLNAQEEDIFQKALAQLEPQQKEEVMEVTTSWMRQGIEIGRLEGITLGRQEGRQEGQRKEALGFLLRLLRRRFGFVSNALQERITALSVNELKDLGEALLDFTELREVSDWLNRRA